MSEFGQIPGGGRPFGDIYAVNTPHIDQLANALYAEQKQREVIRQRQAQQLDEEYRKNVANVRDTDIPEYTKKYQDWKRGRQELMRIRPGKNQDEFIAKQMEVQRKLADVYELGNKSKQAKDEEEEMAKDLMKNPNNYDDNAFGLLSARRKLPLSQMSQYKDQAGNVHDLTNYDTFRYKGSNTDFGAVLDKAIGTPKQVYTEEKKVDDKGHQTDVIPYTFGNTPSQVKDRLMGAFALHQAGRDAEHQWDTIPDEEKVKTLQAFQAIPADKWKKMGIDNPQDLTPKNGDSKTEKLASLMAMQYALSNEPKQGTPVRRNNQAAIDETNFQQQKQMEAIRNANANRRLALQDSYVRGRIDYRKAAGKKDQEEVLTGLIKRTFDEGAANKVPVYVDGKSVVGRKIAVPAEIAKKYTIEEGKGADKEVKAPIKFIMTEDMKYVVPVYAGESTKQREGKIPIEQYRDDLGKLYLTKKDAAAEMDELDFGEETDDNGSFTPSATPAKKQAAVKHPLPAGKPKTVQQGGHTYTWNEATGQYE
jgi:hypothetical protein